MFRSKGEKNQKENKMKTNGTFLPSASTPLPSSSTWNLRFSRRITLPVAGLAQAASTSLPTQSDRNVTGLKVTITHTYIKDEWD